MTWRRDCCRHTTDIRDQSADDNHQHNDHIAHLWPRDDIDKHLSWCCTAASRLPPRDSCTATATNKPLTCDNFTYYFYYPAPVGGRGIVFGRFLSFFLSFFVSLSATLRENGWTDLHEIFRECMEWPWDDLIKFWVNSGKWVGGSKVNLFVITGHSSEDWC